MVFHSCWQSSTVGRHIEPIARRTVRSRRCNARAHYPALSHGDNQPRGRRGEDLYTARTVHHPLFCKLGFTFREQRDAALYPAVMWLWDVFFFASQVSFLVTGLDSQIIINGISESRFKRKFFSNFDVWKFVNFFKTDWSISPLFFHAIFVILLTISFFFVSLILSLSLTFHRGVKYSWHISDFA